MPTLDRFIVCTSHVHEGRDPDAPLFIVPAQE